MRQKVTVVGAGNVGATLAQRLVEHEIADVVLIDIVEGIPQGKALDIMESAPVVKFDARMDGSNSYELSDGSDVIVVTAGLARKPGMSRDDLVQKNQEIVGAVVREAAPRSPDAMLIVVSNPLDAMCEVARRVSGFPRERVFGMAGILDSARMRWFLAEELHVSVESINAFVLGGHGDTMVPLPAVLDGLRNPDHRSSSRRSASTPSSRGPATGGSRSSTTTRPGPPTTPRRPPWPRWWSPC